MACYGVCVVDPVSETKLAITSDTSYAIGERSRTTFSDSDLLIAGSLVPASVEGEWPTDRPGKRAKPTWNHPDAEGTPRNLWGSHLTHEGALADDVGPKRVRLVHALHYYPADRAFDDPLARDGERWEL